MALLEHDLLHRLFGITGKCIRDQAAVAVLRRTEPFEPQRMSGHQCLQRSAAVIGNFDRCQPQSRPSLSSNVRPSRTVATFAVTDP